MKTSNVIKHALFTEKTHKQMEKGLFTFLVDAKANKHQIEKAISKQFAVAVEKVNVLKSVPKTKRIGRTRKMAKVGGGKKATVWVKKGQTIASLLPKSAAKKSKSPSKEKEAEKISAEGKEA